MPDIYEQAFVPKDAGAFNELVVEYRDKDLLDRMHSSDGIVRAVAMATQERLALRAFGSDPWTKDPNA